MDRTFCTLLSMVLAAIASAAPRITLTPFSSGLQQPVALSNAGDARLFAVEQGGTIRIVRSNGSVDPTPFLDITARVSSGAEEGLLGLAFHPDYATNGFFYVNYTSDGGQLRSRISRFTVTANPDVADPLSELILLTVDQPSGSHNAGWLGFGPDGYLYVPLGDGGQPANGQLMTTALGKLLRVDVDSRAGGTAPDCVGAGTGAYLVPAGNPFVDGPGGTCDEAWSVGLRNPWRSSFDRQTGDLWIADVGQYSWEEIDLAGGPGENYGWRCYEGNHPYDTSGCGAITNFTFPIFEYSHANGDCSVTGGYVYRGSLHPALAGIYVLTDYCSGNFWMIENDGGTWVPTLQTDLQDFGYTAFGESAGGELFVVNHGGGTIATIGVDPCGIHLSPMALPDGLYNMPYSQTFIATPGTPPYTYAVTAGMLPPGLGLDAALGTLSGTPTAIGTSTFAITVTDSGCSSLVQSYDLTVVCTIVLTPSTLPEGVRGTPYSQAVVATGGTPPYTYSVSAGVLPAGLALDPSTGVISGTPTSSGTTFDIRAADGTTGCAGVRTYFLGVPCPTVTLSPATLPGAIVGTPYNQMFTGAGGTAPYTFSLTGSLPAGLTFDSGTGVISGLPTIAQTRYCTIRANDVYNCLSPAVGFYVTASCPVVTVSPSTLPGGTVGVPYVQTISGNGGTPPYDYVAPGVLPPGVTLDGVTGVLAGTPTTTGIYNFDIFVFDVYQCGVTGTYTVNIGCGAIVLAPASLPGGTAGTSYSQTVTASGGRAPYSYYVTTTGTLPPGLSLGVNTGVISGIPTAVGTSSFTIKAMDANLCYGTRAYVVTIGCPAVTLAPASLPNGNVGGVYSQTVTANGGTAPYAFELEDTGSLPSGLVLGASTGVITGTPTATGTSNFTIVATDVFGCTGSHAYSITIDSVVCGPIAISPATMPPATEGLAFAQALAATGGAAPYTFAVTSGALPVGVTLSAAGLLSGTPTRASVSSFSVTATDLYSCAGTRPFTIEVDPAVGVIAGEGFGSNGVNGNAVRVFTRTDVATSVSFQAYGAGNWGTSVSSGNINGGAYDELLSGPGPGAIFGPQVKAFVRDGTAIQKVNFFAYGTLTYGVNAAGGDLDGDGMAEMLSGPGPGEVFGPHVRGWNYDGVALAAIAKINFFAYSTLKYGVNVEEGNVDGDAFTELLTGPGPGVVFSANARGWSYDGVGLTLIAKINFVPFAALRYGVNLAGGDLAGDGTSGIAVTPGPGPGAPYASQFLGYDYGTALTPLPGYGATAFATRYGGRVNLADANSDGTWELLAGAGRDPAASSQVKRYGYAGGALTQAGSFLPFGLAGYGYGVNVAGGGLGYYP